MQLVFFPAEGIILNIGWQNIEGSIVPAISSAKYTGSQKAQEILNRWAEYLPKFWQLVTPSEAETAEDSAKQASAAGCECLVDSKIVNL